VKWFEASTSSVDANQRSIACRVRVQVTQFALAACWSLGVVADRGTGGGVMLRDDAKRLPHRSPNEPIQRSAPSSFFRYGSAQTDAGLVATGPPV
jgi:hypothetical protein